MQREEQAFPFCILLHQGISISHFTIGDAAISAFPLYDQILSLLLLRILRNILYITMKLTHFHFNIQMCVRER